MLQNCKKSQLKFLEWIQGFLRHPIIKKDNSWNIVTINKLSQKIQQKAQKIIATWTYATYGHLLKFFYIVWRTSYMYF